METEKSEITLTDSQQSALNRIMDFIDSGKERVFILKGYAGTGKTTLVKTIIREIGQKHLNHVLLASTGRAAKVLSDSTKTITADNKACALPAKTIHSLIYKFRDINQDMDLFSKKREESADEEMDVKLKFVLRHHESKQGNILYIIDEASMISDSPDKTLSQAEYGNDCRLLDDLLKYDPLGKFLFIGDACQLPPINQNFSPALNPEYFRSMFNLNAEEAELTEVMRQSGGNDIVLSASRVRKLSLSEPVGTIAKFPFRGYRNIHLIKNDYEMLSMYLDCIRDGNYTDATMIVMSNKTAYQISKIIRPALGFKNSTISAGDLLLVTQNNMISGLMNGDLVKVKQIKLREHRAGLTFVNVEVESLNTHELHNQLLIEDILYSGVTNISQKQQTSLFIDYHDRMKIHGIKQSNPAYKECMMSDPYLNALRCSFGYALTCHKSQGGEWNNVFLMIPRGLPYNNPRNYAYQWVYTAMTRAKQELYVIDDYWVC